MSLTPEPLLAALDWNEPSAQPQDGQRDLQALADGAFRLARQSRQPDERRAFEELATGAVRLARQ